MTFQRLLARARTFAVCIAVDFQLSLATEPVASARPETPLATLGTATVASVLELLCAHRAAAVLVYDGNRLTGIFTERDALRLMAKGGTALDEPISKHCSPGVVTIADGEPVGEALRLMSDGGYRNLPVIDAQGAPKGIVTARGIVHYIVQHFPQTVYNLPPTSRPTTTDREGA